MVGAVMLYVERYGCERIMFGSDFPFGNPVREMNKVLQLPFSEEMKQAILDLNVRRLLSESNRVV